MYARAGSGLCTFESVGARVGVVLTHHQGTRFSVRTTSHTIVEVDVEVPAPLLILEDRVRALNLSPAIRWSAEVNFKTAREFGTKNIKLFLPQQISFVRENFLLDDYEMRMVSENGREEVFCTFATVLMAWKQATDDNST